MIYRLFISIQYRTRVVCQCKLNSRSFKLFIWEWFRQHKVDIWRFYCRPSRVIIEPSPISLDLLLIIASHCKRCERARKEQQLFSPVCGGQYSKSSCVRSYKANINSHNIFARYFMNVFHRVRGNQTDEISPISSPSLLPTLPRSCLVARYRRSYPVEYWCNIVCRRMERHGERTCGSMCSTYRLEKLILLM